MLLTGSVTTSRLWTQRPTKQFERYLSVACRTRFWLMIERASRIAVAALVVAGLGVSRMPTAGHAETGETKAMKLGYVELADDPRYVGQGVRSGILFADIGRPYQASQVAL